MYYEPYRGKERARARRKPGCVKRLIHFAVALFVVWAGFMLISGNVAMPDLFGREAASLSVNTALPGGWTNILLLGTDKEESGYGRSDSIIIASISDRGEVKLTSIMRDTMVDMGEMCIRDRAYSPPTRTRSARFRAPPRLRIWPGRCAPCARWATYTCTWT